MLACCMMCMRAAAGQTTALGEPLPSGKGGQGQQGGSGSGAGSSGAGAGESAQAGHDPRAETALPDKTGQYAAIGAVSGVFLGWASQFF